jgi:putative Mg2+ transporter-C (MgtC) family protein
VYCVGAAHAGDCYFPAILATLLTLGTLSVFRKIESKMPSQHYAHFTVRFRRESAMAETALRALVREHDFTIANLNYQVADEGRYFEYGMVMRTPDQRNVGALAKALNGLSQVVAFRIAPTGD